MLYDVYMDWSLSGLLSTDWQLEARGLTLDQAREWYFAAWSERQRFGRAIRIVETGEDPIEENAIGLELIYGV